MIATLATERLLVATNGTMVLERLVMSPILAMMDPLVIWLIKSRPFASGKSIMEFLVKVLTTLRFQERKQQVQDLLVCRCQD